MYIFYLFDEIINVCFFIYLFSGERNFHVLFYLYDGLESEGRLAEFHLDPILRNGHRYLPEDARDANTRQTNVARFQQLKAGFSMLGFREEEVSTLYRILAAILHLGDLEFGEVVSQDNTDNKSRVIDLAPLHRCKSFNQNLGIFFIFLN